jgi:signal transduction histidine kinase
MQADAMTCSVLLIDAAQTARAIVQRSLESVGGARWHFATSAENVTALACAVDATVVLLDLLSPAPEALEVIRQLRAGPRTAPLPVIVLSWEDGAIIKLRAFEAGADEYLVKWPDPRALAARLLYHSSVYLARKQRDADLLALQRSEDELRASQAAQLLAYARCQPLQPVVINSGAVLRDMQPILHHALGSATPVPIEIEEPLWNTLVDPGQLQNVMLNLAANARDAMGQGGVLTIRARNVPADEAVPLPEGGDLVLIEVCDNGSGMPPDVLAHAFEPFFTTKPKGQGAGLGLSMAYGFVKQSGGEILLESAPQQGTRVRIFLRRCEAVASQA